MCSKTYKVIFLQVVLQTARLSGESRGKRRFEFRRLGDVALFAWLTGTGTKVCLVELPVIACVLSHYDFGFHIFTCLLMPVFHVIFAVQTTSRSLACFPSLLLFRSPGIGFVVFF